MRARPQDRSKAICTRLVDLHQKIPKSKSKVIFSKYVQGWSTNTKRQLNLVVDMNCIRILITTKIVRLVDYDG